MLRRINNQIHALAPTLKKLKSTGVYHYPDVPPEGRRLSESKLVKFVEMTQQIVPPAHARFLIGEFVDESGRPYLMLVNKDLSNSFRYRIELQKSDGKLIHISPYSGQEEPFGREMDWVAPRSRTSVFESNNIRKQVDIRVRLTLDAAERGRPIPRILPMLQAASAK